METAFKKAKLSLKVLVILVLLSLWEKVYVILFIYLFFVMY